jgi:hypothetical protein
MKMIYTGGGARGLLSAAGTLALLAACANHPRLRGELAPIVEPLVAEGRAFQCPVVRDDPVHGRVYGCWTQRGDTTSYFYRDATGTVTSAGEMVSGTSEASERRFEEELRTMHSEAGKPSLICDRTAGGWEIRDRRWITGDTHKALIVSFPLQQLGARSFVQRVAQIGPVDCQVQYSVPFAR